MSRTIRVEVGANGTASAGVGVTMVDFDTIAVVLIRLVGAAMVVVSLAWGTGNVWRNWQTIHPSFVGYFVRKQTARTTSLLVAGVLLIILAETFGQWLVTGFAWIRPVPDYRRLRGCGTQPASRVLLV